MTNDPNTLMTLSACYRCIPKGAQGEVGLSLLDRINQIGLVKPFPVAPVALAATNAVGGGFTANWNAALGATTYYLDVSEDINFGSFATGFQNLNVGNVTTFNAYGLYNNTTYYYRVRASASHYFPSANSNTITQATLLIHWEPVASQMTWNDKNGAHTDTLANFIATADFRTVSQFTYGNTITSITNSGGFPGAAYGGFGANTLTTIEAYGQTTTSGITIGSTSFTNAYFNDIITSSGVIDLRNTTTGGAVYFNSLTTCPGISGSGSFGCTNLNFAKLQTVTSSGITISANARLASVTFGSLTSVAGSITLTNASNAAFTTLDLSTLQTVTGGVGLSLSGCSGITSLNLSSLTGTIPGINLLNMSALASALSIPNITSIGNTGLSVQNDGNLTGLTASNLTSIGGNLTCSSAINLGAGGSMSFASLLTIGGNCTFGNNSRMTSVSMPLLSSVTGSFSLGTSDNNWTTVSFPALTTIGINWSVATGWIGTGGTTVSFPALQTVGGTFTWNTGPTATTSMNFSSLASIGGSGMAVTGVTAVGFTTFTMPALTTVGASNTLQISTCTKFTTINLPALITCKNVTMNGNTALATLNFGSWVPDTTAGDTFTWNADALPSAAVNAILAQCVAVPGVTAATIDTAAGTNGAPSGQGIIDKATLIGRGCTVNTN